MSNRKSCILETFMYIMFIRKLKGLKFSSLGREPKFLTCVSRMVEQSGLLEKIDLRMLCKCCLLSKLY